MTGGPRYYRLLRRTADVVAGPRSRECALGGLQALLAGGKSHRCGLLTREATGVPWDIKMTRHSRRAPSSRPEPNGRRRQCTTRARSWHADVHAAPQTRRSRAAPKSPQRRRRTRPSNQQRRQCPHTTKHHRPTPPARTDGAYPQHDRRSTPKKPKFWMTAPCTKTTKRPPCRCLFCAKQHPLAAVFSSSSLQEAPQTPDAANKTPLS